MNYIAVLTGPKRVHNFRELVKTTILEQDPPLGWEGGGGFSKTHLSLNTTNNILLAFKFELTQEYSASKSRH